MNELLALLFLAQAAESPKTESCGECHERAGEEFSKSVHAASITCTSCHGGNGEIFDERKAHTPNFRKRPLSGCLDCHEEVGEFFKKGEHFESMLAGSMRGCVECHEDHLIAKPTPRILVDGCARCHENQPDFLRESRLFGEQMLAFEQRRNAARDRIAAAPKNFSVRSLREGLGSIAASYHGIEVKQHSVEFAPLAPEMKQVAGLLDAWDAEWAEKETAVSRRRLLLIPIWAVVLLNVGFLAWKLRRLRR